MSDTKSIRRVTLSKEIITALAYEIDLSANELRDKARLAAEAAKAKGEPEPEYPKHGFAPQDVVRNRFDSILELVTPEWKETIFILATRMVPSVLGETPQASLVEPIISGLELPRWFSVPAEPNGTRAAGWVKDRDASPNQIQRVVDHKDADILGRQVERNKFVLLRAQAIEEGCELDQPISTVFGDG
jgi:hypothetical protein